MTDKKRIDDDQLNEIAGGASLGRSELADDPPQGDGGASIGGNDGSRDGETNPGGVGPGDTAGGTGDGANQEFG